ncbi:MAG: alpha/beta hydrolase [Dehalococcoidia bacterium]|nr:alpha/beta hydrolase [Dehalococcoidia bacterium]
MPFAQVNDARMFYTDEGEGSPVLMVHGWSCDGSDWAWQIPALKAAGYRCITPDLRGHGRSSVPAGGYPRQYAADLAGLIGQLGCGPVVAIGHSMGGATVVALAVEHPEVVRAVVPVDSAYGFESETAVTLPQMTQAFRGPGGHDGPPVRQCRLLRPRDPCPPPSAPCPAHRRLRSRSHGSRARGPHPSRGSVRRKTPLRSVPSPRRRPGPRLPRRQERPRKHGRLGARPVPAPEVEGNRLGRHRPLASPGAPRRIQQPAHRLARFPRLIRAPGRFPVV